MRVKNSLKNVIASTLANIFSILVGLIAQSLFLKIMGKEYLGLNGLFTNIISMLGIVELGLGNAIVYSLYKPIANNDYDTINSLMRFYKKCYHIIGIIVLIIGLSLLPFLSLFVGPNSLEVNIYIVFVMFLLDSVFSYFLSYKRSILYANQKNYFINILHIGYIIITNLFQIIILFASKNFYLYLIIKIFMRLLENLIISFMANKMFPYLINHTIVKLDKNIEKDIFKKIKALFFHQIGSFVINGTDNIIISKFLGLAMVGLYSNYYLIINSLQTIIRQFIQAMTPSVGNLLVTESKDKQFEIFKKIRFLNFVITSICSTCLFILMDNFITIWIGPNYLLPKAVLLVLIINFYQKTSRETYASFKTAAGIFYEDRFVPLIESFLNIVISIIGVKLFGLIGVFIGTLFSGFVLWFYSYPKFVYKKLFNKGYINYLKETVGYILLFSLILFITYMCTNLFAFDNRILSFFINIIMSISVPIIIIIILFHRTDNFKYYFNLIIRFLTKIFKFDIKRQKKKKEKSNNQINLESSQVEYDIINMNNINNYLDDLDRVKMKIRFDNSVIKDIDFNKCPYEISNIILDESKVYNFEFNNDHLLRNNKYPKQIANNYELMKYILDYDYNYLAYIDPEVMDNDILIDIINYAFTKVYYLKVKNNEIDFDINNMFKKSKIIKHSYFKECYSYIDKMNGRKKK